MKIRSLHGYFIFEELRSGDISRLMSLYNIELSSQDNYFTFAALKNAPNYSLIGGQYLGAASIKTYEGKPWEVMRENGLVYDFINDEVVPISSITQIAPVIQANNYFLSSGLIMPGSLNDSGLRVKEYSAWYLFESGKFRYTEVSYE